MKTSSAKAKGRTLQQKVRDLILKAFPSLKEDDVRSTSMGNQGEDVQLSPAARSLFPFTVECKSYAKFAVYQHYEQAKSHKDGYIPLLVIKANYKEPLAVLSLDDLLALIKKEK